MITCVAIDDEPLALDVIAHFINSNPALQLTKSFTDPFAARNFLLHNKVDLLFLDIQMPEINGMQLYASLTQPPPVIFTTAFSQYAVEGFNLEALDYLLKPIEKARFLKAVNRAEEYYKLLKGGAGDIAADFIFIKSDYQLLKLEFKDVLYFEALDDYIKIITSTSSKPILTLMPMKNLLEKLPAARFARVHRSFIVPLDKIESIRNKRIKIGDKLIPIGDSYSADFFKLLGARG